MKSDEKHDMSQFIFYELIINIIQYTTNTKIILCIYLVMHTMRVVDE